MRRDLIAPFARSLLRAERYGEPPLSKNKSVWSTSFIELPSRVIKQWINIRAEDSIMHVLCRSAREGAPVTSR
jgi:hypothetical protein